MVLKHPRFRELALSQSQWIVVFLFVGFIVFITIRGELPKYRAAIFSGVPSKAPVSEGNAQGISPGYVNPDPSIH